MLADKDRIFTNLYGFQPWTIDAAMARGDYQEAREYRESRNDWITLLDDGYQDKRVEGIFR